MAEWLKAHAWKACMLQKGIEGSNPSLSASFNRPSLNLNPDDITKEQNLHYEYLVDSKPMY